MAPSSGSACGPRSRRAVEVVGWWSGSGDCLGGARSTTQELSRATPARLKSISERHHRVRAARACRGGTRHCRHRGGKGEWHGKVPGPLAGARRVIPRVFPWRGGTTAGSPGGAAPARGRSREPEPAAHPDHLSSLFPATAPRTGGASAPWTTCTSPRRGGGSAPRRTVCGDGRPTPGARRRRRPRRFPSLDSHVAVRR
jgi:hypothetical protein